MYVLSVKPQERKPNDYDSTKLLLNRGREMSYEEKILKAVAGICDHKRMYDFNGNKMCICTWLRGIIREMAKADNDKQVIEAAVKLTVKKYGKTLRMLGKI